MVAKLLVGTAGWMYPDWEGKFYPQPRGRGFEPLAYYAQFFDTVEIDSSFYRPPSEQAARGWLDKVSDNPRFVFAAKLWQKFTHGTVDPGAPMARAAHRHDPQWTDAELSVFKRGIDPLFQAGKLVALLWQFPWSFRYEPSHLELLARLVKAFQGYPNSIEVRHASWLRPEALNRLRQLGLGFCNIDQPQLRDCLPPTDLAMGDRGYFRLHGRNTAEWFGQGAARDRQATGQAGRSVTHRYDYLYSEAELRGLLPKLRSLALTTKELLVIFNNHNHGQAATNAFQFLALGAKSRPTVPAQLATAYPDLAKIGYIRKTAAAVDEQSELF